MEPAILTAATGLIGSIVGAASSLATTWFTQRSQQRAQWQAQEVTKREALYAEFIAEASKCLADAVGREPDGPEVLVNVLALLGRMRLRSSRPVVEAGERLLQRIVETYAAPNQTFAELRAKLSEGEGADPLADFGEACRTELEQLRAA